MLALVFTDLLPRALGARWRRGLPGLIAGAAAMWAASLALGV
jgi:hypothetical protein